MCPPNQIRRRKPSAAGDDGAWVDLVAALGLDDDALMERLGRWYVPRRDPAYLRRNLLVVLANTANPHNVAAPDDELAGALSAALSDHRPLVRPHAVWATRKLGLDHLLTAVVDDSDPEVRAELAGEVRTQPDPRSSPLGA
ncbi:MAG: HEAT repeat domain-containing protein [Acidimicrobiales bacterium]